MNEYCIANTTREKRAEISVLAESINSLGAKTVAPEDQVSAAYWWWVGNWWSITDIDR